MPNLGGVKQRHKSFSSKGGCRPSLRYSIVPGSISFLIRFLIQLSLLFRIGEAANPGPYAIGTFNPTGLLNKGQIMSDLPHGLWGVSESHLTRLGVRRFKDELNFAKECKHKFYTNVVAEKLSSSEGSIGGKAQGVGILTSLPGRSLPVTWGQDVFDEARVYAGTAMQSGQWIKMGVMYGYAFREKNIETRQKSNKLLSHLVQRVVYESKGPRVVCGDFNQDHGVLEQTSRLQEEGFVELQQYAKAVWGQAVEPTCKGKTTKDFVWISRELIPFLQKVVVDPTMFADHAVVYGVFKEFSKPESIPTWPKPLELPWDDIGDTQSAELALPDHSGNPSVDLPNVMHCVENFVHQKLQDQGKGGLLIAQRGRSQRTEPTWCKHPSQPPRVGRVCDIQPEFCGENITHNRWLRQLRRLMHLEQLLARDTLTPDIIDQASQVWCAIKSAPGFKGGFRSFWIQESSWAGHEPNTLPRGLPSKDIAGRAYSRFLAEFRAFEQSLKKARVERAKQARRDNPSKIYQDVKKPRAIPVQTVVTKQTATVVWVSDDGTQCQYEPAHLDIHEAVHTEVGPISFTAHTAGSLEGLQGLSLEEGDLLYQDTWVSSHRDIFKAFETFWIPMWQKHQHDNDTKWDPFVAHCLENIPQRQHIMDHSPITLAQWQKVVGGKKAKSAMGPDGITRKDLISMPVAAQQAIVDSLNDIEGGSQWPVTCLLGLITSLEKHDRAKTVCDYRPICIFSLLYRCWASLRAREMLQWLSMIAPPNLMGSCPGRDASMLWYQIASLIEEGNVQGTHWAGLIADLSKCFNILPRIPVMLLARKYGIPSNLCRVWQAALSAMPRRFVANGAVSPQHYSCNGFPEGDPLSVVAMMLVNLALNEFMQIRCPIADCWTFVDDWQLTANNAQDIQQGLHELTVFTQLLDIPMDSDKSAVWSTDASSRRDFRTAGLPITYHGRNLGGHLTYCKVVTNYTIQTRIAKQKDLWVWLQRSFAPHPQKLLALMVVAWPRCLHGISVNMLGSKHFTKMRTKAVQSLGDHRKGTSPLLHLSCLNDPRTDPEFYACWLTIKHFRVFSNPQIAFPMVDYLLHVSDVQDRSGPCSVFIQKLQLLGWTWKGGGFIEDHEQLPLHILHDPVQWLWLRARHAWWARILAVVSQREGFQGLASADVIRSIHTFKSLPDDQRQLLVVSMNGTFFTRDKLFASGHFPSKKCPWCEHQDSVFHRHWECHYHQSSRAKIPSHVFNQFSEQPECMMQHGWCQESPHRLSLACKLLQLPDLTRDFHTEPTGALHHHLFTDGSCLSSHCQELRVATWGVVIASLEDDNFRPVSQGPLQGLYQTIFRAEATAFISACRYLLCFKIKGWIWSDNQQLVDYVNLVLKGCPPPSPKEPDHDVLESVRQLTMQAFDRQFLQGIVKVRSHESLDAYDDVVQQWVIRGNDAADKCAADARQGFDEFFGIWQALTNDLQNSADLCNHVHMHFVRVGLTAVQQKAQLRQDVAQQWAKENGDDEVQLEVSDTDISWATVAQVPDDFSSEFFGVSVGAVIKWLQGLTSSPDSVLQWVTTYQLLVDFQVQSGLNGMRYIQADQRWCSISDWEVHW